MLYIILIVGFWILCTQQSEIIRSLRKKEEHEPDEYGFTPHDLELSRKEEELQRAEAKRLKNAVKVEASRIYWENAKKYFNGFKQKSFWKRVTKY